MSLSTFGADGGGLDERTSSATVLTDTYQPVTGLIVPARANREMVQVAFDADFSDGGAPSLCFMLDDAQLRPDL